MVHYDIPNYTASHTRRQYHRENIRFHNYNNIQNIDTQFTYSVKLYLFLTN
jgi:hypothetical protein